MPDIHLLGRSVVVAPGGRPPPPWAHCERVAVPAVSADLAAELHAAWRERRPLVVELSPGIGLDDPLVAPPEAVTGLQPWEWPVDLDLPAERLHHAVWANSVDARGRDRTGWRWADEARRAGAGLVGAGDGLASGGADIVLPDGRVAFCDGGPLDVGLTDRLGTAVLHRVSIEHGSLEPLTGGGVAGAGALAPDQLAAVGEHRSGARVIAPAGSGKTRVLTERARTMIAGWRVPAPALALVAYNVRAADEMRDRLKDQPALRIRTLNALGLRLCGRASTIDEREVRSILSSLVSFPRRAETDPAAPWIEALSRLRLGLIPPGVVEEELGDVSDLERVARTFRSELAARNVVDFDDQVVGAVERLLADPALRARSQRYARVLLVDEFQDLTPAHLLLIRLLSGPAGSVFGVGDDDQTIYGYAGATPRWLVDYDRWFPGSASHSLEVNYRCPPAVVRAASNLLSHNTVRVAKEIRSARAETEGGSGKEVTVLRSAAGTGPSTLTGGRVEELLAAGADPTEIVVLSRVNASLVPVQVLLGHRGVPVDARGDRRFLQRGGVRAALAWLEIATAPAARLPAVALREAARRPRRGMSNSLLDLLARPRSVESLDSLAVWLEGRGSARESEKVDAFARDVGLVRRASPKGTAAVLGVVRRQIGGGGLDATASALDQWSHGAIAAHLDDLDALTELAQLEPDPELFPSWLAGRLDGGRDEGGVTLASIHAVKGREWDHVVLHHVTDGLLPHRLSLDEEEERRIFHVGLTRAATTVSIVCGAPPSPFVAELDRQGTADPARPGAPRSGRASAGTGVPETGDGSGGPGRGGIAGRGRPGTAGGGSRRRTSPTSAGGDGPARSAELRPVMAGLVFLHGGQEHEVLESGPEGAMCLVGGGPARTVVRYGTEVAHSGRTVMLAHPRAPDAWERLRAWRTEKARELAVPPFVVFDDATLRQVAARLPVTDSGLLGLRGVGPAKLEAYGSDLIALAEELREGDAGEPPGPRSGPG